METCCSVSISWIALARSLRGRTRVDARVLRSADVHKWRARNPSSRRLSSPCSSQRWRGFRRRATPRRSSAGADCARFAVHGLDQRRDVLRRRRRDDAVPEIEDVPGRRARRRARWPPLRARRSSGSVSSTSGSRLPCSATRAPTRARARRRGRRSSRARRTTRRIAAMSSSHCPPPLVNTIVGTRRPSGAGRSAASTSRIERERERAVRVGRQQPAPGVEDHHRVGAGRDLLVEIGGDRLRVDVDEALQQVRAARRPSGAPWRSRRCRRLRSCSRRA